MARKPEKPDPYDSNKRCYCTLAGPTRRLLDILATTGSHGGDRPDVMTFLILRGIQNAFETGYLPDRLRQPPAANTPSTGG
jgi:hypothetical protein